MHYEDSISIENFKLIIVVYKHVILSKPCKFDYQITSIKKCEYVNPYLLLKLFRKTNKYFKSVLKDEKQERWYEIEIGILDGYDKFYIKYTKDVSDSDNELDRLH